MANPEMRILGMHPVEDVENCFLIEAIVTDAMSQPEFGKVAQPRDGRDRADWQVAYDEGLLDADGQSVLTDLFLTRIEDWPSRARVSFYLHDVDLAMPLTTPFGDVPLPSPTPRPSRLAMLVYEAP